MNVVYNQENLYGPIISRWVKKEFPRQLASGAELVDVLSEELLGTKRMRNGPKPSVESQAAIREVLRKVTNSGEPIPFMVPWGSEKPNGGSVDLAELGAVRMMTCLHDRVRAHYAPGVLFNVRLEDASAPYLFAHRPSAAAEEAKRYTEDFTTLLHVLDVQHIIRPRPESLFVTSAQFNTEAEKYTPLFRLYITAQLSGNAQEARALFLTLTKHNWAGELHMSTLQWYLEQYEKAYPRWLRENHVAMLARYFASALARKNLNIRGDDAGWNGTFLDFSFVSPTVGVESHFARRLYYRTLPLEETSNHLPPWRAKGYLRISNDGEATAKLHSFNDLDSLMPGLTPAKVVLEGSRHRLTIDSDYQLL